MHVRAGAGAAALGDFLRVRDGDVGRMRLCFGQAERGLGLIHASLKIAWIDLYQHLAGLNGLIVVDEDIGDVARDFRGDRD